MRALVLSDIHGNLEALEAVLAAAGHWDALWNLGDMVGYGGSPNEVLDRVRPISTQVVRGNHDRVCCGLSSATGFNPTARAAATWTHNELTAEHTEWLRGLPRGPLYPASAAGWAEANGDGRPQPVQEAHHVTLAHGSPLNEDTYILSMRDAWAPLQQMHTAVTFVGHTHVQGGFWQREHDWHEVRPGYPTRNEPDSWRMAIVPGTRQIINPGSVGQPRDCDWRAAFAIYDTARRDVMFHRVPYDVTAAQGRILMAGLPERLAARLREGR
ncbi:MAG: metallophosphatase family protein [Acidobacteriota bacterium]|nr:metallophosphatase family protein [Acidobacteriota bacterium]